MELKKEWYKTEEEMKLAEHLLGLEEAALREWFNGDSTSYQKLWSAKSFSYFDGITVNRIDSHDEIVKLVKERVDGRLYAESYEVKNARVQPGKDMAVLTYQLYAKTNIINIDYNCIEVFQKEEDGWHVIHSTWSIIRPMEMDFSGLKDADVV